MIDSSDAQYLTDPRTVDIADGTGSAPEQVVEAAEMFAVLQGDTVEEELTRAAGRIDEAREAGEL